jgi:V/A-type H+/Na+-transporting ATPase subunit I
MIVSMRKITFVGLEAEKERFLDHLQQIGVVHLIFPQDPVEPLDLAKELSRVTETRKFLASRAGKAEAEQSMSAREVCEKRESLGQRESRIQTEIVALKKERSLLEAWGDFSMEELGKLRQRGLNISFFRVTQKTFDALPLQDVYHQVVGVTKGEVCFITVSDRPISLEIPEEKVPAKSLSTVRVEISDREEELKKIETEYGLLAAHLDELRKEEVALTNLLENRKAALNAGRELENRLFVVKCWSPLTEQDMISRIPATFTLYHYSDSPSAVERVPVLLNNKPVFDSGEDLVKVYSHPSYKDFDPSGFVLYCFAVFFGMIVGDAGYGLTLLALTFFLQKKFRSSSPFAVRFFRLMYFLGFAVTGYGIISGGYFGVTLGPDNPLSKLCLVDVNTKEGQNLAMILSIIIGMIHISMSFVLKFRNTRDIAALGWIVVIWSGYFLINSRMGHGVDNQIAKYVLIAGFAVVFIFSSSNKNPLLRLLEGLNGLLGIVQVFSDVLSYLRLFALGIATVYMAQTFNMLAKDIVAGMPWFGYLFAALVLFAGHSVNLLLGIMGGVIHGLRLNFLEWYRWCFTGDGLAYKPFRQIKL